MEDKKEKLLLLCKRKNGHVLSKELIAEGFSKYDIAQFVKLGLLDRVSRGKYVYAEALNDEFMLVQQNNSKMIFSNETALYLHDLTGRFPSVFTVTTENGYHLRNKDLKIYYVKPEHLYLGMMKKENYFGNTVLVYDKERTICDIIKNKNRIEQQVYIEGLQNYFLRGKPDLKKLARYAKTLGIQKKVMDIVMLYLNP